MLWKSVTALIVLFWAVMTALLVRQTYFPADSRLTQVSVNTVQERASQHRSLVRNTLSLSRKGERLGHADIGVIDRTTSKDKGLSPDARFTWQAGGMIEGKAWGRPNGSAVWRFEADVDERQAWQRLSLALRVAESDTNLLVAWKKSDDMPKIEVRQQGELIMDTQQALAQAKEQQASGGLGSMGIMGSMLPSLLGRQTISLERLIHMQAHKTVMSVAEEERRCHLLTLSLLGIYQAKFYFSETGELARVELPQGWELLDPLLVGLTPTTR